VLQKPKNKQIFGQFAENFAVDLLLQNGYQIKDRNFHSRFGEIDIVCVKDNTLIFVEVKARHSLKFGYPEEAVTKSKLLKIRKTGEYYSLIHPGLPKKLRIDVVAIVFSGQAVISSKIIQVGS